jgi:hypothetical protein
VNFDIRNDMHDKTDEGAQRCVFHCVPILQQAQHDCLFFLHESCPRSAVKGIKKRAVIAARLKRKSPLYFQR